MWILTRVLGWRWRQPALIRWLTACALFGVALAARFSLGTVQGAIPFLSFYPAILIAATLLGWKEALFVLTLSISAGCYFFLSPGMVLLPVGWVFVGLLNISIIIVLRDLAQKLALANERQKVLFQELQHRVANTLHASAGKLEVVRRRLTSNPAEAAEMLDDAIARMSAAASMHRRLHDPSLFSKGLEPMMRDVLATVIDQSSVSLNLNIQELDLSMDQKSIIAMLVMEIANNSTKHVFLRNLGSRFDVALLALPGHRAVLKVEDDGPGVNDSQDEAVLGERLGMRILYGLTDQLGGTLVVGRDHGCVITITFQMLRSAG